MVVNMSFYVNYLPVLMPHIKLLYFGNFKLNQHINIIYFFFVFNKDLLCVRASMDVCNLIHKKKRKIK